MTTRTFYGTIIKREWGKQMKKISISDDCILKNIEKANRKEDLKKLLELLLAGSVTLTLLSTGLGNITDEKQGFIETAKNSTLTTSLLLSLKILYTKLTSYNAKLRLERIMDLLEEEKIYIGVDSLQEARISTEILEDRVKNPNTRHITSVSEIVVEDRKGQEVILKEYEIYDSPKSHYDVELIAPEDEVNLTLK